MFVGKVMSVKSDCRSEETSTSSEFVVTWGLPFVALLVAMFVLEPIQIFFALLGVGFCRLFQYLPGLLHQ